MHYRLIITIWYLPFIKSTDGGDNWAPTAGQPAAGWATGQGWYALAAAINPSDANQCIVGGLNNYKTTNGGASWTKILLVEVTPETMYMPTSIPVYGTIMGINFFLAMMVVFFIQQMVV